MIKIITRCTEGIETEDLLSNPIKIKNMIVTTQSEIVSTHISTSTITETHKTSGGFLIQIPVIVLVGLILNMKNSCNLPAAEILKYFVITSKGVNNNKENDLWKYLREGSLRVIIVKNQN